MKQNMIELVKEVKTAKDGEEQVVTETYWSSSFIPAKLIYEANDIAEEFEEMEQGDMEAEKKAIDRLLTFLSESVYGNKFTKTELWEGIHAPDLYKVLQEQLVFMTRGQQSEDTKKFLEKKN